MKKSLFLVGILCASLSTHALAKPTAAVSIPPQKFIFDQVAGDTWGCLTMVSQGQDPHVYEPTARQLASLRTCEIYFQIGLPFETQWVQKLLRINPRLVFAGITNMTHSSCAHQSHEGHTHSLHDHTHEGGAEDPHIWMSPDEWIDLSESITHTLSAHNPESANTFLTTHLNFSNQVKTFKQVQSKRIQKAEIKTIVVYHPAWGHFAKAFNLEQIAIEVHGQTPSARALAELTAKIKASNAKVIFVQNQAERRRIESLAKKLNLRMVQVDPLNANVFETITATVDALVQND